MALFVTRSTIVADTQGPTAPIITASAASNTSITVNRTTPSTDISGILNYETQRSLAGAGSWTTFDTSSSNPVIATGLSAGISYDFRQRATDTQGNIGSYSSVVSATTTGGSSQNLGAVGPYSEFNLADNHISTIDLSFNDYAMHTLSFDPANSGTATHFPTGFPIGGGAFCRMTPPTGASQDRGIAVNNLSRGGTLAIQELNYRFAWQGGSEMGSRWEGAKWNLLHFFPTLTPGGSDGNNRPILFAGRADIGTGTTRANTIVFGIAQGTVQAWGPQGYLSTYPPLSAFRDVVHLFYMANASDPGVGSTFNGRPIVSSSEALTFEHRVDTRSTATYPNGFMGLRVWRQNGTLLTEAGRPYRISNGIDPATGTLGAYALDIQQLGCGQYNSPPPGGPNPNLKMDVGTYITVARDLSTLRPDLQDGLGYWLGALT